MGKIGRKFKQTLRNKHWADSEEWKQSKGAELIMFVC